MDNRAETTVPGDLPADPAEEACAQCGMTANLCVCDTIQTIDNRIFVLILQHPQEQDRDLGTARLTRLHFRQAALRIGLSWPNLAKALGRPADPKHWGVLFLGAKRPESGNTAEPQPICVLDRNGVALSPGAAQAVLHDLHGIILLDGSWSQAKTLWWRNPWLLKCQRITVNPSRPSLYGRLRKEPRRDSLSTIEATAKTMAQLERRPEIEHHLLSSFQALLHRYRAARSGTPNKPET